MKQLHLAKKIEGITKGATAAPPQVASASPTFYQGGGVAVFFVPNFALERFFFASFLRANAHGVCPW